jgi:hypothetical protein
MEFEDVKAGMRVKTISRLFKVKAIFVSLEYLCNRKPNKEGKVLNEVPGHEGDVWLVIHDDNTTAAYVFDEFNPI